MKDDATVFRITYEDIEGVLCRELTQEERDMIYNKFSIDDWVETVEVFLDIHEIK